MKLSNLSGTFLNTSYQVYIDPNMSELLIEDIRVTENEVVLDDERGHRWRFLEQVLALSKVEQLTKGTKP